MDAFLSETGLQGQMPFLVVCPVVVVSKDDGVHPASAEIYQALNDVGFTILPTRLPIGGTSYG